MSHDEIQRLHNAINENSIPNKWIIHVDILLRDLYTRPFVQLEDDQPELIFHRVKQRERRLLHRMCMYYGLSHESVGGRYKTHPIGRGDCQIEFNERTGGVDKFYDDYEELKFYKWKNVHVSRISNELPEQPTITDMLPQVRFTEKAKNSIRHHINAVKRRYDPIPSVGYLVRINSEKIPDDCMLAILSYLPATDLVAIGLCNKKLYFMSSTDRLWCKFTRKRQGKSKIELMEYNFAKFEGEEMMCSCKYNMIVPLHSHHDGEVEPPVELPTPLFATVLRAPSQV